MKTHKQYLVPITITIILLTLIVTRLLGLWPDWMIYLELVIKTGL